MSLLAEDAGSEVVQLKQRVPFTMVDNPIIRSMTDYVALGLYLDMLSYPPGWRLNLKELAKTHKQGRDAISAAMRDLVARGLVFRVRYQQAGGTWATRTYVCSSPVTLQELNSIRAQYLNRCRIETSPELSAAANPALTQGNQRQGNSDTDSGAKHLVGPSDGFPGLGCPGSGKPAFGPPEPGQPTTGQAVPQRLNLRPNNPPPPPKQQRLAALATMQQTTEEEDEDGIEEPLAQHAEVSKTSPRIRRPQPESVKVAAAEVDADVSAVLAAVVRQWPQVGRRDLTKLTVAVATAVDDIGRAAVIEHLTANAGGVRNPAAVLAARLDNLPHTLRPRSAVRWCGICSRPDYRWIENEQGLPQYPCPRCSPQATRG